MERRLAEQTALNVLKWDPSISADVTPTLNISRLALCKVFHCFTGTQNFNKYGK